MAKSQLCLGPERLQRSWNPAGGQGGECTERGLNGCTSGFGKNNSKHKAPATHRPRSVRHCSDPGRVRLGSGRQRRGRLYLISSGGQDRDIVRVKFVSSGRLLGRTLPEEQAESGTGLGGKAGHRLGSGGGRGLAP